MLVVSEGLCHGLLSAESWPCQGNEPRDGPASCSAGEVKTLRAAAALETGGIGHCGAAIRLVGEVRKSCD